MKLLAWIFFGAMFLLLSAPVSAQTYIFGKAVFPAGELPAAVAYADFNGDGITDLAVANADDNTISILLGKPEGVFAPQVTYGTGTEPVGIAVADFNGDGNVDLAITNNNCTLLVRSGVVACSPTTVSILLGNGDGTFLSHVDYSGGLGASGVVAADFNGDGKLDLAIANAGDRTVSVLLGNGDGTFQAQVSYAAPGGVEYGSLALASIVAADFNGDGKLDLAVGGPSLAAVLLGNGDGTFRPAVLSGGNTAVGTGAGIAVGDFNGDGKLDLILSAGKVLLGNGDGTFSTNVTFSGGMSVAAADLNGDGKPDFVVGGPGANALNTDAVSVFLGNGDGTFQNPVQYAAGGLPLQVALADLNGDGKLDIASADSAVSVLLGLGDGTFVKTSEYVIANGGEQSVVPGDFNHDGNLDLATNGQNSIAIYLGSSSGTLGSPQFYAAGIKSGPIAISDFRNNGILDLVTPNYTCILGQICNPGTVSVLLGNGDGTFQPQVEYPVGLEPLSVAAGDFRNNGKPDLAVVNQGSATVSILLGNGDGTFQPQVSYATIANPSQVLAGDFNGDGKLDLAVVGFGLSILLGNGDGTFKSHVDYYPTMNASAAAAADFNGDGKLDLVIGSMGALSIFLGKGDGTFTPSNTYAVGGTGLSSIAVSDFNQDGNLDLAFAGLLQPSILLGNGDGSFVQPAIPYLLADTATFAINTGDFNQDGVPDLVGAGYSVSTGTLVGVLLSTAFKAVSPGSLNFGSQGVGTTSSRQVITISNPTNVKIGIASIAANGDFAETNDCGSSLSEGTTCQINVTFSPSSPGTQPGSIIVTDNTRISPLAIPVQGSGVNGAFLTMSRARLNFPAQLVGTTSNPATLTLSNTGNAALNFTGISITGADVSDFSQINNCPSSLATEASCNVTVTFKPTAAGTQAANLAIHDSAPGNPQAVALSGVATAVPDFSLNPSSGSSASQSVSAGQTATFSLSLAGSGTFSGAVNLGCAVTPAVTSGPTCNLSSSSEQISGGTAQSVTVKIATTAPSMGMLVPIGRPSNSPTVGWIMLCTTILFPLSWRVHRSRKGPVLAVPVMLATMLAWVACGGSGSSPTHNTQGTPPGTYTATVTATSGSLSHTMPLKVTVQ